MLPDKVASLGIPGKEKGRREKLEGKKKDINTHYWNKTGSKINCHFCLLSKFSAKTT